MENRAQSNSSSASGTAPSNSSVSAKSGSSNVGNAVPMEVDPIDGGPLPTAVPTPALVPPPLSPTSVDVLSPLPTFTQEVEGQQVIKALRSEDMGERVHAAHQLPAVAALLGPHRTRTVRI
jgi:hypothetical protein